MPPLHRMVFVACHLVVCVCSGPSHAATYVCEAEQFYDLEEGQLVVSPQGAGQLHTWPSVVFDDISGSFKYGREGAWTEEAMTVTGRGSAGWGASGHYLHNGTLFNAFVVQTHERPANFLWLGGGLSDAVSGTCRIYGE
jgi:hypothetical protein